MQENKMDWLTAQNIAPLLLLGLGTYLLVGLVRGITAIKKAQQWDQTTGTIMKFELSSYWSSTGQVTR